MDPHDAVRAFIEDHDLHTSPEYRILDLVSEVGELGKNVNTSTDYGNRPGDIKIQEDELGDVLFATYALAYETGIDPGEALGESLDKYRNRLRVSDDPGSANG